MPSFVVTFKRAGANYPAVLPTGTVIVDYQHDGDGGTHYIYDFADTEAADQFAALVAADTFTSKRKAVAAFEEAAGAK